MNTTPLKYSILDSSLINTDFIRGEVLCNYELYLTEILNASQWMSKRYAQPFVRPKSESKGECDAYAGEYGIDYKLITSQTMLKANSLYSPQITKVENGVILYHAAKCHGSMRVVKCSQALRGLTYTDFLRIQNSTPKRESVEYDVKKYLDIITTEKNLLLFFPYRFKYEVKGDLHDDVDSVIFELQKDFVESLTYRTLKFPKLDTYFTFIYDNSFALCLWKDKCLKLLEIISVKKSDTIMYLISSYCYEWYREMYLTPIDY